MKRIGIYAGKNLLRIILLLFAVSILTFALVSASPIDPLQANVGQAALGSMSEKQKEKLCSYWGVDEPPVQRYLNWLNAFIKGDGGMSLLYRQPVTKVIAVKLGNSLFLMGLAWVVSGLVGFLLGVIAGVFQGRLPDKIIKGYSLVIASTPSFWLALLLMYIFAVRLGWFKVVSTDSIGGMILPVATLTIPMISSYARQIRAALLEELNANYVIGARARGIPEHRIIWGHVLPNAILPIITLLGLSVGHLLGGAAIIETIFSWKGIGNVVVEAIRVRDYPLIQGYVIWMAIIYVTVNLIVDISYRCLDPQIRLRKRVD